MHLKLEYLINSSKIVTVIYLVGQNKVNNKKTLMIKCNGINLMSPKKRVCVQKIGISINKESASSYFISGSVRTYQIFQHEMLYQLHLNCLNARTKNF